MYPSYLVFVWALHCNQLAPLVVKLSDWAVLKCGRQKVCPIAFQLSMSKKWQFYRHPIRHFRLFSSVHLLKHSIALFLFTTSKHKMYHFQPKVHSILASFLTSPGPSAAYTHTRASGTDEALSSALHSLVRRVALPYYRSISSQQSLPIRVIRQQSACLREHWSREMERRGWREGWEWQKGSGGKGW